MEAKPSSTSVSKQLDVGMELQDRDNEVVIAVYENRVMLRDQIQKLFFPSRQAANQRLTRLAKNEYLEYKPLIPDEEGRNVRNSQRLYFLGEKGVTRITTLLGIPREDIPYYRTPDSIKRIKKDNLEHMLLITEFRVALTLAAKRESAEIITWIPDSELKKLKEAVIDRKSQKRLPVNPDAYFIYQHRSGEHSHFFLELDRSTMENRRFAKKVKAYTLYRGETYKERYGANNLRVLTVVPSHARLRNLKTTTKKVTDTYGRREKMFWFTTFSALEPDKILREWEVNGSEGHYHLLYKR